MSERQIELEGGGIVTVKVEDLDIWNLTDGDREILDSLKQLLDRGSVVETPPASPPVAPRIKRGPVRSEPQLPTAGARAPRGKNWRQRILDEFRPGDSLTRAQIVAAFPGEPTGAISSAMHRMLQDGQIVRDHLGYRLPHTPGSAPPLA